MCRSKLRFCHFVVSPSLSHIQSAPAFHRYFQSRTVADGEYPRLPQNATRLCCLVKGHVQFKHVTTLEILQCFNQCFRPYVSSIYLQWFKLDFWFSVALLVGFQNVSSCAPIFSSPKWSWLDILHHSHHPCIWYIYLQLVDFCGKWNRQVYQYTIHGYYGYLVVIIWDPHLT